MKPGKQFEADFRAAIEKVDMFQFRPKDCPAGWHQNKDDRPDNIQFTSSNEYDLILYIWGNLFTLEMKSYGTTAFPFKGLRKNQEKGLLKSARHTGVTSGVILNFRKYSRTFFIPIDLMLHERDTGNRKSINLAKAEELGVEIKQTKLRVHYTYDILTFVKEVAYFELEDA
jgi:penicillin-binding protein-related factor A (putative recombinase)